MLSLDQSNPLFYLQIFHGYVGLKEISYASNYPDIITTMVATHLLADVDLQLAIRH